MVYTKGSRGAVVRQIQARVGAQVTGAWDTATARKVAAFQTHNNVKATGQVDKETYDLLFPTKNTTAQPTKQDTAIIPQIKLEDEQEIVFKKLINKTKNEP
jgi:hypothetical protein